MVPTVRVVITFTKFIELQSMEDDFHTPPSSPGPEDESSSGDYAFASSSGGEEIDPFEIPRGYTWIRNDSTSKKTRKIETTTSKKTTSE